MRLRSLLLLFLTGFFVTHPARAEFPEKPVPLAIELQPPFGPPYSHTGESLDGDLLVGGTDSIGIFDGVRWRHVRIPGAGIISAFGATPKRIWLATLTSIGWLSPTDIGDGTFHHVIDGISETIQLLNVDQKLVAITLDEAILISADGAILDRFKFPRPAVRYVFRWENGWMLVSRYDAHFVSATTKLNVTTKTPIDSAAVLRDHLMAAVRVAHRTLLVGVTASYDWNDGKLTQIASPDWQDIRPEHLISAFTDNGSRLLRLASDGGLKGFDPVTLEILWQLKGGEHFEGVPNEYPLVSKRGIFITTDSKVYWIPNVDLARRLSRSQQRARGISHGNNGVWVCTPDGSWKVPISSWSAAHGHNGITWAVDESPFGTLRGQTNIVTLNDQSHWLKEGGGEVRAFARDSDSIVILQWTRVSRYTAQLEQISSLDMTLDGTSVATTSTHDVIIGTVGRGLWRWATSGRLESIRQRGTMSCTVAQMANAVLVLWNDGQLDIGSETINLPAEPDCVWNSVAVGDLGIVAAGRTRDGAVLSLVKQQTDGIWNARQLDHPALRCIRDIAGVAVAGDRIGIAGTGGTIELALSFFDQDQQPATPRIGLVRAGSSERGAASLRRATGDPSQLALDASEDEVRFVMQGGPEYWTERVRFRYRMTPDSADWTDLDPANEITLQRIGTGTHTLEIEGRSLLGSRTSRFAIVRPPHWYFSGWAYGTYAMMLASAALGVVLWRTRRLSERARLLEERVAQRTSELQKANEAKSEFLASMSHEIRNPLNGVIGISGMLREAAQSERDRRLTESLRACADQLRLVLDDILDFSAIERGNVQLQLAPFPAGAAVRAAVLAIDPKLERTQLTIAPGLAEKGFYGDEGKVRQIVSNLVSNAHRYGVPPEATVEVKLLEGQLTIAVSNTGPDIPPEDRDRIFGSFERGRSVAHRYTRGAGLGLTISRRFAHAMGGEIRVSSENGLTCFTFSAPLPEVATTSNAPADTRRCPGGRVLAVEDETYNRLVLGHVLNQLGYEVDWAENGAAAIDIFTTEQHYTLILTDWMLPDIPGDELVRRLKTIGGEATPPIVAVTAYATAEKRGEAFEAGVAAFVTKPITREKLEAVLLRRDTPPAAATTEPLRLGVLLETVDPTTRLADYRRELEERLAAIARGIASRDANAVASTAHRLASQLLAIHHHTLADELRALESAATRGEWDLAQKLHANAQAMSVPVMTQLHQLELDHRAEPRP